MNYCIKKLLSLILLQTILGGASLVGMDTIILPTPETKRFVEAKQLTSIRTAGNASTDCWLAESLYSDSSLKGITYSPNGKLLLARFEYFPISLQEWYKQEHITAKMPAPHKDIRLYTKAGDMILELDDHATAVYATAFNPQSTCFLTSGARDNAIRLWDVTSGSLLKTLQGHHSRPVYSIVFNPQGTHIIGGSADATISVWDPERTDALLSLKGHKGRISSVSSSQDGRTIVSASGDKTARLWDFSSGQETLSLEAHATCVVAAELHPSGDYLLTASADGTALLWDLKNLKKPLIQVTGYSPKKAFKDDTGESLNTAFFTPQGTAFITSSWDKTIALWDSSTGEELMKIYSREESVAFIASYYDKDKEWGVSLIENIEKMVQEAPPTTTFILEGKGPQAS